jgi:protein TonB
VQTTPGRTVASLPPEGAVTRVAQPKGGYQVRPSYPSTARRLGIQGTTMLRVHVLADGRVGEIAVEESAGHPDLDQAAADAVRRWRFEPARSGEQAVAMWVRLPVEFHLTR